MLNIREYLLLWSLHIQMYMLMHACRLSIMFL